MLRDVTSGPITNSRIRFASLMNRRRPHARFSGQSGSTSLPIYNRLWKPLERAAMDGIPLVVASSPEPERVIDRGRGEHVQTAT
jgi:hypothetical protein